MPTPDDSGLQMDPSLRCPICVNAATLLYEGTQRLADQRYQLRRCQSCRSIFSDPLPDDLALSAVYRDAFDYQWYATVYASKLRDAISRVRELRDVLGSDVLDFGGGPGYFGEALKQQGYNGLSYDPMMNPQTPAPAPKAWDSVVALHVLEHSNKPAQLLGSLAAFLRPDGHLILAVPNADGEGYRRHGMSWVWAQPPLVHVVHFTRLGLVALLDRCGFEVIECRYNDRWDANHIADVLNPRRQKFIDGLAGSRPFRGFPWIQRGLTRCATALRWQWLRQSQRLPLTAEARAELLVIARPRKTP